MSALTRSWKATAASLAVSSVVYELVDESAKYWMTKSPVASVVAAAIPGSRPIGTSVKSAMFATRTSVSCLGSETSVTDSKKTFKWGNSFGMIAETIRFVMTNSWSAKGTSSTCRSCSKTAISSSLDDSGSVEDQGALLRVQLVCQELQPPERRCQVFIHPEYGVPRT